MNRQKNTILENPKVLVMLAFLLFSAMFLLQHHPPPPPPAGFGIFSVIVLDDVNDDQDEGREFGNGRFRKSLSGDRRLRAPNSNKSYRGFCAVYEGILSGNIVDLNQRNWNDFTEYVSENLSEAAGCDSPLTSIDSACQFAVDNGSAANRGVCELPITDNLVVLLALSFLIIVFRRARYSPKSISH